MSSQREAKFVQARDDPGDIDAQLRAGWELYGEGKRGKRGKSCWRRWGALPRIPKSPTF